MANRHWQINTIPAFCITLERRQDRWRRFQDQPGLKSLEIKRFLGVDGKTLDIRTDTRVTTLTKRNIIGNQRRSHEELDTAGGVGCALSHIAMWQWIVDNDHDAVLVFEDDAVVPSDFVERANKCIQDSIILKDTHKWDMWLLGGIWEDLTQIPNDSEMVRIGSFALFHAYVLTKKCAKKFLEEAYPIHCHIDIWASIYGYLNNLRYIGCPKFKLEQTTRVKTDIQKDHECKLCNVPTEFYKTHQLISKSDLLIARVAEVACIGLVGYFIYQQFMKSK